VNTGESRPDAERAWLRVRRMQTKLHQWASMIPTAGLMICSTSSTTRTSSRWPGNG